MATSRRRPAVVGAGAAEPQPCPHRHLPAPELSQGRRAISKRLLDHSVKTYYPGRLGRRATMTGRRNSWREVAEAVAETGARWIAAGFVHGVLNTDNINITGESFDYGPWRFLPTYDPAFTAAYFDESGLYAFGRQPDALAWNLTRLAECLLPLGEHDALEAGAQPLLAGVPACDLDRRARRLGLAAAGRREGRRIWCARSSPSSRERRRPTSSSSSTGAVAMPSAARAAQSRCRSHYSGRRLCTGARTLLAAYAPGGQRQSRPSVFRARNAPHHADRARWRRSGRRSPRADDWSAL